MFAINPIRITALAALCVVSACTTMTRAPSSVAPSTASSRLATLFDDYFEERLRQSPLMATSIGDERYNDRFVVSIAPAAIALAEKAERDYLQRVQQVSADSLTPTERISRDIFIAARQRELEGQRFHSELLPFNQFYGMPISFVQLGSGAGSHLFGARKDYDDFLARAPGFVSWVDQALVNMRAGMAKGYVQPKVLMERVLPQLAAQIVDDPEKSRFLGPGATFPESLSESDRVELTARWRELIMQQIVPAYRRLQTFVREEYLPACRDSVSLAVAA